MSNYKSHFKRIGVLYLIVALVALLNVLIGLLAIRDAQQSRRQSESAMATAFALVSVPAMPTPFQPEEGLAATPLPTGGLAEPTVTLRPSPTAGPYTVGPINFDDPSQPISILIGDHVAPDRIFIPAFAPYSWDQQYESEEDVFAAFRNTGLAWLPGDLGLGLWLHSGTLDGVGLPMYDFQQLVEVNDAGNRRNAREIEFALHDHVIGRTALVSQGHCVFDLRDCTVAHFLVVNALRIPPELVEDSQQYLSAGAFDWFADNYGPDVANSLAGDDTFFIRTCGRQAAGESYDDSRPHWQQSRFIIALRFISAAGVAE